MYVCKIGNAVCGLIKKLLTATQDEQVQKAVTEVTNMAVENFKNTYTDELSRQKKSLTRRLDDLEMTERCNLPIRTVTKIRSRTGPGPNNSRSYTIAGIDIIPFMFFHFMVPHTSIHNYVHIFQCLVSHMQIETCMLDVVFLLFFYFAFFITIDYMWCLCILV